MSVAVKFSYFPSINDEETFLGSLYLSGFWNIFLLPSAHEWLSAKCGYQDIEVLCLNLCCHF